MKRTLLALSAVVSMSTVSLMASEDGTVILRIANDTDGALKIVQNVGLLSRVFDRTASFRIEAEAQNSGKATHQNSMDVSVMVPGSYTFTGEQGATYIVEFKEGFTKWPNQRVVNYPADFDTMLENTKNSNYVKQHHISVVKE